jgi:putative flippase GtrA
VNYQINSRVTFIGSKRNLATFIRFAIVTASSIGLSTLLFWLGYEVFGLFDLAVVFFSNVLVAFYTFTLHRLVTFKNQE